jgi:hypothetical protein
VDDQAIRAAALLASAIAHSSLSGIPPPGTLTSYADGLVPYIAGASRMTLTLGGTAMPIDVDSTNEVANLGFADDHGDKVPPPAGAVATATSSDTSVMTVGAGVAATDTTGAAVIQFPLTAVAAGTVTLSVHATAADGSPLLGPSGATIPDAAPVTVTVNPGAAAEERFTVPGA